MNTQNDATYISMANAIANLTNSLVERGQEVYQLRAALRHMRDEAIKNPDDLRDAVLQLVASALGEGE